MTKHAVRFVVDLAINEGTFVDSTVNHSLKLVS